MFGNYYVYTFEIEFLTGSKDTKEVIAQQSSEAWSIAVDMLRRVLNPAAVSLRLIDTKEIPKKNREGILEFLDEVRNSRGG